MLGHLQYVSYLRLYLYLTGDKVDNSLLDRFHKDLGGLSLFLGPRSAHHRAGNCNRSKRAGISLFLGSRSAHHRAGNCNRNNRQDFPFSSGRAALTTGLATATEITGLDFPFFSGRAALTTGLQLQQGWTFPFSRVAQRSPQGWQLQQK